MKKNQEKVKAQASQQDTHNDTVYGVHAVVDSLKENLGNKLYIQDDLRGKNVELLKKLASDKKVGLSFVSKEKLKEMADGGVHQGFVLKTSAYAYHDLSDLLALTEKVDNPLVIIIDGLTDPHNLGSILRTADATGVSGVIIPKHRSVGVTPVVVKTATGAVNHIPIARVTNLSQTLDKLKASGFWIFGTDLNGTPHDKWQTQGKLALIIGAEGAGITPNIKKQVDEMITIPMRGHVQSLNAGVAAGILMYEWARNSG
ncbi:MAG: 23S rRNA (guanosine(2251)-2'-O)-methyltransferase RlmB [Streptococcaceae bacterium]|nr:23S rRNA (guanosine(2251)-2'-O)-methyltransferase RlmB [Streptococcaceae bacterium]